MALAKGSLAGLAQEGECFGRPNEVEAAHPLRQRIAKRVLEAHQEAHHDKLYDGSPQSAFERLASVPVST